MKQQMSAEHSLQQECRQLLPAPAWFSMIFSEIFPYFASFNTLITTQKNKQHSLTRLKLCYLENL
jgi:hypothetical protein